MKPLLASKIMDDSNQDRLLANDTLWIGLQNDSLVVQDNWNHSGTIVVVGDGKLIFNNVKATIRGNIVVWGVNAVLRADNSYLYFPQEYFYQRSIIAAGGSTIRITKTTLDNSGLPHNMAITDSSTVIFNDVTNLGFTTCGVAGKSKLIVDKCNETGEFIIQDSVSLSFANAGTVLLWHLVADGEKFSTTFPDGKSVTNFSLTPASPGMQNIRYDVDIKNCTNVLWGLMPRRGSDIHIKNSKIRSIGLWFNGRDTVDVKGLVNNSSYTNFTAPLTDRTLLLENTDVQTWSLYPFDESVIKVSGCIVGEIGAFNRSRVNINNVMVDGSGGYLFSSDTAILFSAFSSATCTIRSERKSILLFAHSALSNGVASAIGNSILIAIQSSFIEEPSIHDDSEAWNVNISGPSVSDNSKNTEISGSAWIDKTPTCNLMNFKKYILEYQKNGESIWNKIGDTIKTKERNNTLGIWQSKGMNPGNYNIRLTLCSDSQDEFCVSALKSINLLPEIVGVQDDFIDDYFNISPNPTSDFIEIDVTANGCSPGEIVIYDVFGTKATTPSLRDTPSYSKGNIRIDVSGLTPGVYFVRIGVLVRKFVKL